MDPYEPLNVARNVNSKSFETFVGILSETRKALFSPSKAPCIGDIGLEVSEKDRITATQLKTKEESEIKAALKARANNVTQAAAAAKQQKDSKKVPTKAKTKVRFETEIGVPPASYRTKVVL